MLSGFFVIYIKAAQQVIGVDISEKMLKKAQEKNADPRILYQREDMETVSFPPDTFDVVLSSLAFHYLPTFAPMAQRVARWLSLGGIFVFSVEHPVFTAYGTQDWYYDCLLYTYRVFSTLQW